MEETSNFYIWGLVPKGYVVDSPLSYDEKLQGSPGATQVITSADLSATEGSHVQWRNDGLQTSRLDQNVENNNLNNNEDICSLQTISTSTD